MDKIPVSDMGDAVITNGRATVLADMDVDHSAAGMLIEALRANR
jgi:chaperonin GroEL (HSP60 family)